MAKQDPRVDAYIESAAPFARPILTHLRRVIHRACPGVAETMKWGMPAFDYEGPLAHFAAFKEHAVLSLWKGQLLFGGEAAPGGTGEKAMGHFGRIRRVEDLPAERTLISLIKRAVLLNEAGVRLHRAKPRPELRTPPFLMAALEKDQRALASYNGFSVAQRREYIEWVSEAKTEATRRRRVATAVEWLSEGKQRNWKYRKRAI